MAYKTKFLHFKTKASYDAERAKTTEGSEERKVFDAYISFIDEGPSICFFGNLLSTPTSTLWDIGELTNANEKGDVTHVNKFIAEAKVGDTLSIVGDTAMITSLQFTDGISMVVAIGVPLESLNTPVTYCLVKQNATHFTLHVLSNANDTNWRTVYPTISSTSLTAQNWEQLSTGIANRVPLYYLNGTTSIPIRASYVGDNLVAVLDNTLLSSTNPSEDDLVLSYTVFVFDTAGHVTVTNIQKSLNSNSPQSWDIGLITTSGNDEYIAKFRAEVKAGDLLFDEETNVYLLIQSAYDPNTEAADTIATHVATGESNVINIFTYQDGIYVPTHRILTCDTNIDQMVTNHVSETTITNMLLTNLSSPSSGSITASDSILSAFSKTNYAISCFNNVVTTDLMIKASALPDIPLSKIPAAALERLFVVESQSDAMSADVQEGDVVQIGSDGPMYFCISDTASTFETKFKEFTVGSAASVPWSGITDMPSSFTPSEHTHTADEIISGTLDIARIPSLGSNKITSLPSYVKASTASAISASDSLNVALGKLEYKIDNNTIPVASDTVLGGIKLGYSGTDNTNLPVQVTSDSQAYVKVTSDSVVSALGFTPIGSDDIISAIPVALPNPYALIINGTSYTGSSAVSINTAKTLSTSTLSSTTVSAGYSYYNTVARTISTLSGFSATNPDTVIVSTAKLTWTSATFNSSTSNVIKMDGLADLSGTYYIYCLSYMANGKVAVNGAVYA